MSQPNNNRGYKLTEEDISFIIEQKNAEFYDKEIEKRLRILKKKVSEDVFNLVEEVLER